jgi:hypothetical protein
MSHRAHAGRMRCRLGSARLGSALFAVMRADPHCAANQTFRDGACCDNACFSCNGQCTLHLPA